MNEADNQEPVSKTRRKREMHDLQDLGKQLTKLPPGLLAKCELPEELARAIDEYKRLPNKHGALRRQMQFIGRLMREVDREKIDQVMAEESQKAAVENRRFHRLEALRDELIAGNPGILEQLIDDNPGMDIQYLRQLVRQAQKEAGSGKKSASRKLFACLRELPVL